VPADDVETAARVPFEDQTGQRLGIDCGADPIHLKVNAQITCLLTDTIITLTAVTGTDFVFDIQAADVPNNVPKPTVEPESERRRSDGAR
jgi:hypothetical protein